MGRKTGGNERYNRKERLIKKSKPIIVIIIHYKRSKPILYICAKLYNV